MSLALEGGAHERPQAGDGRALVPFLNESSGHLPDLKLAGLDRRGLRCAPLAAGTRRTAAAVMLAAAHHEVDAIRVDLVEVGVRQTCQKPVGVVLEGEGIGLEPARYKGRASTHGSAPPLASQAEFSSPSSRSRASAGPYRPDPCTGSRFEA